RQWRLKEPRGRTRFLSEAERGRLLGACRASLSDHLYAIVVLAMGTGGRRQEIADLQWSSVDPLRRMVYFEQTKNEDARGIPLTGLAWEVIRDKVMEGEPLQSPYVFPGLNGPQARATLFDTWDVARKRAKLVNFRFHDLRHTFASYVLMNG